jgi:hypothetical protein
MGPDLLDQDDVEEGMSLADCVHDPVSVSIVTGAFLTDQERQISLLEKDTPCEKTHDDATSKTG